jgi:putative tryptophan/tyrosine transport system substrate-binding protein
MSYGVSFADLIRKVGVYSGWIAKGARPIEFPVQQDMKSEFVINLDTANALGFTVPVSLLARADATIQAR